MKSTEPTVQLTIEDQSAVLVLNRGDKNAINLEFAEQFRAAAVAIFKQQSRTVIITGGGKNFSFGGDLRAMRDATDVGAYLHGMTAALHDGLITLAALDVPVIAAVNGTVAGGGLGIALIADLIVAGRSAKFVPAYTSVGLTPDAGVGFLLPRAIGRTRAIELLLTNRILHADEALSWGLINQVVDDALLMVTAHGMAHQLRRGPQRAYASVKRLLSAPLAALKDHLQLESQAIIQQAASSEGNEGINAFLGKRAPVFGA
jgi:2-(1,2-epoxy-1,2-dihydrophenyl)acetyl-CoA isomerase